ncbi:MAG TPA: DNA translocase FtsK [Methylomirabilota bacterium]|nr:DNA translocase FtsK [Methylomirabilota bacterium]
MARKEGRAKPEGGLNDIIGIIWIALAFLFFLALYSYDPADGGYNRVGASGEPRNWAGSVGVFLAYRCLLLPFGAAAFLVPFALLALGLGYLFEFLSFLKRRWFWFISFILSCICLLQTWNLAWGFLADWQKSINAPIGGLIGLALHGSIFKHFGAAGATVVLLAIYAISLLFLTNFQLGAWLRQYWAERAERKKSMEASLFAEEKALAKKSKELEKESKKLEAEARKAAKASPFSADEDDDEGSEKSTLGADLQPVPEPTVRDLSVPQARPAKAKAAAAPESEPPADIEGEVISAKEVVAAASSADILGTKKNGEEPHGAAAQPPLPLTGKPKPKKVKPITVASGPRIGNYQLPSANFLNMPDPTVRSTESKEDLVANARLMQKTLAEFDIEVSLGDITKGPTITRYELHPVPGVRLEKITALTNNIAAALKAERINVLAPIPGKSSVGVEVPNAVKTKVIMRDLLESEEWVNTKARIPLALGKDVYGNAIIADLAEMPHLLIAGSTGSGKSVCINSIIASLLYRFAPDELRFVMIDPKVVELQQYNALPHLVVPVVTDPKKVILALRWVVNEMEKRYQIFAKVGVRNIKSFNERPKKEPEPQPQLPLEPKKDAKNGEAPSSDGFAVELDEEIVVPREDDIVIPERLSYIVVIIDELADLMLVAPADVEMAIARITQMARAAGIHCIVATQRPSVDVITGVIKANIPARIAFQVAAKVDSRTILDAMGADKLLGKGDMLYLPPGTAKLTRAQGVLVTDQEIQSVVDFIAKQGKPSYEVEIHEQLSKGGSSSFGSDEESDCDEDESLIEQCIEVIRSEQKASVSLMQRRLRLGYTRAARIMDELERRGIVGPSKGAEPRDILIDLDAGEPEKAAP